MFPWVVIAKDLGLSNSPALLPFLPMLCKYSIFWRGVRYSFMSGIVISSNSSDALLFYFIIKIEAGLFVLQAKKFKGFKVESKILDPRYWKKLESV